MICLCSRYRSPEPLNVIDNVSPTLNTCQGDSDLILPNNEIHNLIKVYLATIVDNMDESSSTDPNSTAAPTNRFELMKITDIDDKLDTKILRKLKVVAYESLFDLMLYCTDLFYQWLQFIHQWL